MTSPLPSSSTSNSPSPRQYILAKLDAVAVRLAQCAQLRTHKHFRVSVPQAITGSQLIQHIQEVFSVEDTQDALHLAMLLMHYGYLFPVIEQSPYVKDDGTLYRLQLPYFWPSHSQQTDNVEYAIYLNKRLMRNEQKHGLEEDEIDAYNKLVELLGHMWSFITTQAEMQLKIQKERKKVEKVVFDSEERAFWRQRRPGQPNSSLEEPMQKVERRLRKCNIQGYRQTIERLKLALKTKPWLKALKGSETLVYWSEQFHDYDPFLSQPQPSNPWITDDASLWALNADNVEVPTERRVKRWGLSVLELVRDPIGRQVLETFLESEFSSENLRFWMSIQDLKYSPNCQIETKAQYVLDEYLAPGAPCQVNVDSRTVDETFKSLKESDVSRRYAFSIAEEHVFTLMSKDSYPRFLRSQIYKGVLSAAQQQGTRRLGWRNFVFNMAGGGGTNQKKTPITTKHKASRTGGGEDLVTLISSGPTPTMTITNNSALPKQLSSDSLPLKTGLPTLLQPPGGGSSCGGASGSSSYSASPSPPVKEKK